MNFDFIEFDLNSKPSYLWNVGNNHITGLFWDNQCKLLGIGPDK